MNKLKRILAGTMAITALLSATSCFQPRERNRIDETSQIQHMLETSYNAIEIDAKFPFTEANLLLPVGDTEKLIASGYIEENGQYKIKGFITDTALTEFTEIDLGIDKNANADYNASFAAANDGTIYAILTITDFGDFERPNFEDPDFDYESFDYEAMQEAAEYTYKILTIDESGKIITENEITGLKDYVDTTDSGGTVFINACFALGYDKLGLSISGGMDSVYVTVDRSGSTSEPIDFGTDEYFHPYGNDRDNNFVYVEYDGNKNVIKTLNTDTMQVSPDVIPVEDGKYFNTIIKGSGEYRMYLSSSSSLFGMKDDGSTVEIINWVNSDLTGDYIIGLIPIENGEFLVTEQNWSTGNTSVYRLTKRDAAEIGNVEVINMAMEYTDPYTVEKVKEFNKTNSDYRITLTDYSEYYEWDEETEKNINTPEKQLKQDIATGKSFDIICMSGATSVFTNLAKKDALVDLYTFLDKDSELTREDIVPTMLSACEKDGKLVTLSPSFCISTLVCKAKYCDKENWTVGEFIEACNKLPEGMKPLSDNNTKSNIFYYLILDGNNAFINYENATCDFDNPDFINILEFCNQYPNPGEGDEIDWENVTDEEMNDYWQKSESAVREDRALLYDAYFNNPRDYARIKQGQIGDEITFVGNPTADGAGTQIHTQMSYGIMENSDNKDACWEFIKEIFDEEYQNSEQIYDFPALKSAFDKKFDEAMEKPYYIDENGKKVEYDDIYYNGANEITIDPLTQEECDLFEDFIINIKPNTYYYNEEIYNIITEESNAYFAGDKSAEQTAEIIQNRVSILISEQS